MTVESVRVQATVPADDDVELLLSVVVPVFNQEAAIAENTETIRRVLDAGLEAPFEVIVVSDGSIDRTAERVLEQAGPRVRVIHYDRNLGKGYAVKVGALEARGRYVAYIDADLDLDPTRLASFVAAAEDRRLDFAIGSKRHPQSDVAYPRRRRVGSWLYQQLVRILFRLDVRDTQVGLKVFRREVAEQVLPLLMVKRFAFDLEMLAVARALGFGRIEELPVRLDYQFTGSRVKLGAIVRALVDTAAIFYRLRLLRYYQRKRTLAGAYGWTRPRNYLPLVSVITDDPTAAAGLDYPRLEVLCIRSGGPSALHEAACRSEGEVLAFLETGGRPAGNWISATVPFLRRGDLGAVVVAKVAPHQGSIRQRAAAAISESRLGGGSLYFRFTPGNLRYVRDFPGASFVILKERYLSLGELVAAEDLAARLTDRGDRVLYTPETVVVGPPPPLFRPHLDATFRYGRRRGAQIRRRGLPALRPTTLLPVLLLGFFVAAPAAFVLGGLWATAWLAAAAGYLAATAMSAAIAAASFQSAAVGGSFLAGLVLTHLTYGGGFVRGLVTSR